METMQALNYKIMSKKYFLYSLLTIAMVSCSLGTKDPGYFQSEDFSKEDFYKFETEDSTMSFYTNVRPLQQDKSRPIPIFCSFCKSPRKYYFDDLHQTFFAYVEKDGKPFFRWYEQGFYGKDYRKRNLRKPRNIRDLTEYLQQEKISYKIIDTVNVQKRIEDDQKIDAELKPYIIADIKSKTYRMLIQGAIYEVTLDSASCQTLRCYNAKDTANLQKYSFKIGHFFY